MNSARYAILGTLFALVVAVGCTGGPSDAAGGSSGSSGGSSSGDPPNLSDAGQTCNAGTLQGERVCVPGAAKANAPITVQAVAVGGCVGCGTTITGCKVEVAGKNITVSIESRSCTPAGVCNEACAIPQVTCTIPGLAAGSYRLDFGGGGPKGRQLEVTEDASASSCTLPQTTDGNISADDFPKSCNPGEPDQCELIAEGSACSPCRACPTRAVSASAVGSVDAKYRELRAACVGDLGAPACAACPPTLRAVCGSSGQCEAQPL